MPEEIFNDVNMPSNGSQPDAGDSLEELKQQNQELVDQWKRTAADFENYKRRKEAENRELVEYSKEIILSRLLPSLQSLEQVLKFAPNDGKYKDWMQGLQATILQLEKTMEELGLVKIKTLGQKFDPNLHEAVEEQEAHEEAIVQEVQPGFTLNGKVIIPAKVIVGKKSHQ
jgi:molecular chaperone GrpE